MAKKSAASSQTAKSTSAKVDDKRTPTEPRAFERDDSADSKKGAPSLDAKIVGLQDASSGELRPEWRRLFGSDPPSLSRDLLARAIAYRIQERAFGGLSRATLRRLEEIANAPDGETPQPEPAPSLRSGARLVREWHGRAHVVTVTDTGFEYARSSYGSLTEIAKAITGAHWSGPRFFGLRSRKPAQKRAPSGAIVDGGPDRMSEASDRQESAHD